MHVYCLLCCAYTLLTKSNQFYFSKASKCDTQYNKKKYTQSKYTNETYNKCLDINVSVTTCVYEV